MGPVRRGAFMNETGKKRKPVETFRNFICIMHHETTTDAQFMWREPDLWTATAVGVSISVIARSKAMICDCLLSGVAGSNPAGGMGVCVLWVLCVVRWRSLRWADPLSRGALPTVVCHCVWSTNLEQEAALARVGLLRQK